MDNEALVSIISPCYNGEEYIGRFLDSVLCQTYSSIELILVNDGSTDGTGRIIDSYKRLFEQKSIGLLIINKENGGQASAINAALQHIRGKYMMWVDSDDVLHSEHVYEKVKYLEQNQQYGMVSCWARVVKVNDIDKIVDVAFRIKPIRDCFLYDLIYEKNVIFNPGVYMVRQSALLEAIPSLQIFDSREGQNLQMLLPLAFCTSCGYLDKVLLTIVRRDDSHSRITRNYQQRFSRIEGLERLSCATIDRIPGMSECEKRKWKDQIVNRYYFQKLNVAYGSGDTELIRNVKLGVPHGWLYSKSIIRVFAYLDALKFRKYRLIRGFIAKRKGIRYV